MVPPNTRVRNPSIRKDGRHSSSSGSSQQHHKEKPTGATRGKAKQGPTDTPVAADVKATSLAAPIPAGDVQTSTSALSSTLPPTATPVFINPTVGQNLTTEFSTFLRKTTTVWITPSDAIETATPTHPLEASATPTNASGHFPTYVFALIGFGAFCLCLGALLLLKCLCVKHARSDRPRPSAPILQESPLFGGKERFSVRLWADQSFGNMLGQNKTGSYAGKGPGWRPLSGGNASEITKVNESIRQPHTVSPFSDPVLKSATAIPLSPASVYTQAAPTSVGLAVEYPLPPLPPKSDSAKSGTLPLNIKDKPFSRTNSKNSVKHRSAADTMYGGIEIGSPMMTETHLSVTTYQTPRPAPSPTSVPPKKAGLKSAGPSRERVQPPRYDQGPPPNPKRKSFLQREEAFMHAIPMTKSQERRDRDTKALTSALGLGSPPPPSSCFSPVSVYPDDSLSVAYGRPASEMPSPTGTHAALGDLMLQDFPSVATFASMKSNDPFSGEPSGKAKASKSSQARGGPPRVPSPPPLPSLAQMALENADPDYRSPTYSLYGFYEAQRKSKTSVNGDR